MLELARQGGDDNIRDLILYGEDVTEFAVVGFGPEPAAGRRLGKLRCHSQAVAGALDAALDNMSDA